MPIAKLSIDFEARLGQFETELKRITSVADGVSSKLSGAFKGIALGMAGIGAGVGLSTLKDKFDSAIAAASGLKEMADKTGASVENLSGLGAVAKITATDMGLVESAMNKLSKGLHASEEDSKGVGKALKFIGLNIDDLRGKDPAENFLKVSQALNKVENGTGKVALGTAIIGKQYTALAGYMKDLAESGDLVVKTTEAQAIAAKNYEEDLRRLTATKDALYKTLALALVPAFDDFVKALIGAKKETSGLIDSAKELSADGSIKKWGDTAVDAVSFVIEEFQLLNKIIGEIAYPLERLGGKIYYHSATLEVLGSTASWDIKKQAFADLNKEASAYFDKLEKNKAANREPVELFGERVKRVRAASMADALGLSDIGAPGKKDASEFTNAPDPRNAKGAGSAKADDYTKIIQSLNEKISVETAALDSTEKLNQAQKDYAKYQADIASGAVKLTGAQKSVVDAYYQVYLARAKEKEFADLVDKQTEAVRQQNVAMMDRVRAIDRETEMYGKTETEISLLEQARLRDAIATAAENGASEDLLATLRNELQLRENISDALVRKDQRKSEFDAHVDAMKQSLDDMSEFSKQAAKNMQDAFADFLFDPFAKGANDMLKSFGQTVQKMIAQAASAQILKTLLGDMGSTGKVGGLLGDLFGSFFKGGVSNLAAPGTSALGPTMGMAALNLPSFAVGTDYVPRDMVAQIHKGERIVPAAQNKPGMQGGGQSLQLVQNFYGQAEPAQVKRAAASGMRSVNGAVSAARRYG